MSNLTNKHYVGMIGCGNIAVHHMNAIAEIENAEVFGVYSADLAQGKEFSEKHNITAYSTLEELLSEDKISIVSICTPSGTHPDIAIKAMEAGKHVIVEKPLALTVEDCERVVAAAKKYNRKCQVICQLRFSETTRVVKEAIDSGLLGKVVNSGCYMKYYREESYYKNSNWRGTVKFDGGGALMNQGIHGVDLMIYLLGMPKSVTAVTKTLLHDIEVEDCAAAIVTYENGGIGVIEGTTCVYPGYDRKFQICGTKGSITLCEDTIEKWDVDAPCPIDLEAKRTHSGASDPTAINHLGHKLEYVDLINAIDNDTEVANGPEKATESVKLILSIYESSKNEKVIKF